MSAPPPRRTYSRDVHDEALRLVRQLTDERRTSRGVVPEVAGRLAVPPETVRTWVRRARTTTPSAAASSAERVLPGGRVSPALRAIELSATDVAYLYWLRDVLHGAAELIGHLVEGGDARATGRGGQG